MSVSTVNFHIDSILGLRQGGEEETGCGQPPGIASRIMGMSTAADRECGGNGNFRFDERMIRGPHHVQTDSGTLQSK